MALTPVRIEKRFRKRLKKKPPEMRKVVEDAVTQLRLDPRHNSLHTHRIWGHKNVWGANLDEGNRLTFHWEGSMIVLRNHCKHDKTLKNP